MGMEDRQRLLHMSKGMILTPAERALIYEQIESAKVGLSMLSSVVATGELDKVIHRHGQAHQPIDYISEIVSECLRRNVLQRMED